MARKKKCYHCWHQHTDAPAYLPVPNTGYEEQRCCRCGLVEDAPPNVAMWMPCDLYDGLENWPKPHRK